MFRTFNMGIGYFLVVPKAEAARLISHCADYEIAAFEIGRISTGEKRIVLHAQ